MLLIENLARELVEALNDEEVVHTDRVRDLTNKLDVALTDLYKKRADHYKDIEHAQRLARRLAGDDVEVDDAPYVAVGDEGVWIGAWIWIPKED